MKKYYLLIAALVLSTNAVFADESPNWNYVDLSYLKGDIDGADDASPDGFGAGLSFEAGNNLVVRVSRLKISDDVFGTDVEATGTTIGLGYVIPTSDTTDFIVGASYVDVEACVEGFGCADDNGYGLDAGFKSMLTSSVELDAGFSYVDIDGESDTQFGLGLGYYLTDSFSLGVNWSMSDDVDTYGLNARFTF